MLTVCVISFGISVGACVYILTHSVAMCIGYAVTYSLLCFVTMMFAYIEKQDQRKEESKHERS